MAKVPKITIKRIWFLFILLMHRNYSLQENSYFRKWVSEIVEIEADEVLKIKEFTFVNNCFQHKSNEDINVFRRTLTINNCIVM